MSDQVRNRKAGRRMLWDLADSRTLASLDDKTFRLWAHMVPRFDIEGRAEVDTSALAAALGRTFFTQNWTKRRLVACRNRLAELGEWIVYGEPGKEIAQDPRFHKHQATTRGEEVDSMLQAPAGWDDDVERTRRGRSISRKKRGSNVPATSPSSRDAVPIESRSRPPRVRADGEGEGEGDADAKGEGDGTATQRGRDDSFPRPPNDREHEASRIRAAFARAMESAGLILPCLKPRDQTAAESAVRLGTCSAWPDGPTLEAEFLRTIRGMLAKGFTPGLAFALDHLGETWDTGSNGSSPTPYAGVPDAEETAAYIRSMQDMTDPGDQS